MTAPSGGHEAAVTVTYIKNRTAAQLAAASASQGPSRQIVELANAIHERAIAAYATNDTAVHCVTAKTCYRILTRLTGGSNLQWDGALSALLQAAEAQGYFAVRWRTDLRIVAEEVQLLPAAQTLLRRHDCPIPGCIPEAAA